jgi:hypothetical protein
MKDTTVYNGMEHEIDYEILAPGIHVYHNVLPKEMNIIERTNSALAIPGTRFKWKQAELNFGHEDLTHRKCMDFKIKDDATLGPVDQYSEDMHKMYKEIIDRLRLCISHYAPKNYLSGINYFECINIVRYGAGEFFKVHTDDGEPYRCTLSAVGYPNDDYAGGELYFPLFGVKYKPKAGDFVINPSAYSYAHSSEPVTDDGIKYSLVIMTDRNEFAHRNDSPTYYPVEYRSANGVV